MEDQLTYNYHKLEVNDFLINKNNSAICSWGVKEVHFWCTKTGKKFGSLKIIDIAKYHT